MEGQNPGLPHCRWILYHLKSPEKQRLVQMGGSKEAQVVLGVKFRENSRDSGAGREILLHMISPQVSGLSGAHPRSLKVKQEGEQEENIGT